MVKATAILIFLSSLNVFAQTLHPLEASKNHYAKLEKLSAEANSDKIELDSLRFPINKYHPVALLYTMATPQYLNVEQIEALKNTVQFPANSSDQTRAELDYLLEWQSKRTKEQEVRTAEILAPIGYWPHIEVKNDHENFSKNRTHLFFEGRTILGDSCTFENYPATGKLLQKITTDMRIMEFTVKYYLLRIRPYDLDQRLKPLEIMGSPSFASGHTLWAYLHAFTWSELVPKKRNQFLDLAYEIGESREIMGIHYPSDDEASRILAHRMLTEMWSNPEFISDLNAAKTEWKNKQ